MTPHISQISHAPHPHLQVANFYNTIDTQIVNSQKPLLLDHALRFEQLATTPKAQQTANAAGGGKEITWSDPTQLEGYIDELRGCSEELMQENRKLRQVHRKMGEQVCTLMETSLLRKKSAWEEQIKKLRAQVERAALHTPPCTHLHSPPFAHLHSHLHAHLDHARRSRSCSLGTRG